MIALLLLGAGVVAGLLLFGGRPAGNTIATGRSTAPAVGEAPTSSAAATADAPGAATAVATSAGVTSTTPSPKVGLVVAWQPSHQDDTGTNWHEYKVCGDIVDRAMRKLPQFKSVKAWDLSNGLTGSNNYLPRPKNTVAFDAELAIANRAHADVFVAVHNDGGAPSGILGEYLPGDARGAAFCRAMVAALCAKTGLPNRGERAVRLYSLEAVRNTAKYKVLMEIGDNVANRAFLMNSAKRDLAAAAMAGVIAREFGE